MKIIIKLTIIYAFFYYSSLFANFLEKRFDSNSQTLLRSTLYGKIESNSSNITDLRKEIEAQLEYLVGHLFGIASPAVNFSLIINFENKRSLNRIYSYKASLLIAWDNFFLPNEFPYKYQIILPSRGDSSGLAKFKSMYQKNCGSNEPFWYYYEPSLSSCPLNKMSISHPYAFSLELILEKSDLQSEKRCPDYNKIWEDGVFSIVHIAGTYAANEQNNSSEIAISELSKIYGTPTNDEKKNGDMYFYRKATFQGGLIVFNAIDLRKSMSQASYSLKNLLATITLKADLISYNGHSGYGENIKAFVEAIDVEKGKYSIGWINACKPFVHLGSTWFNKVEQANFPEPSKKFLDIIMVSHIGAFSSGMDISKLIKNIGLGGRTYSQILWSLNVDAFVIGEEDNPLCQ